MRLDTAEQQPLDPAVLKAWRVRNLVLASAAGLSAVGIDLAVQAAQGDDLPWPPGVLGALVLAAALALGLWQASAAYRRWWVRFGEQEIEMERGILIRTRTTMPYFRLQHVDTHEGPYDRVFGLAGLVLFTAAPSEKAEIPGIDRARVDAVRDHVVARAGHLDAV